MSIIILRNNLNRLNGKFLYGALNRELWSKSYEHQTSFKIPHLLLQKQIFNPCKSIIRGGTTTITIKQYESSRKYTGLWKVERFAGISLIFIIPLAFCIDSKELEMAMGLIAILHTYWGCQSMCNDYVRSSVVGKVLPIIARVLNISIGLATLMGIRHLIYEDCGIVNMIKMFWTI